MSDDDWLEMAYEDRVSGPLGPDDFDTTDNQQRKEPDMDMADEAYRLLDEHGFIDKGWDVEDETTLITPNGWPIEWDGMSPDNEVSPLRQLGMI